MSSFERARVVALGRYEALRQRRRAAQHPQKVLHVNPFEITRICNFHMATRRKTGSKWNDWGRVEGGNWDSTSDARPNAFIDQTETHQAVHDRYVRGLSWEDTGVIEAKLAYIEKKGKVDGCRNREELVARYRRLDETFEDIVRNGYRCGNSDVNDISVSITRNGEFLLGSGGAHRLAIAKVIRLATIPVFVLMRHEEWQNALDRWQDSSPPTVLANHPDFVISGPAEHFA